MIRPWQLLVAAALLMGLASACVGDAGAGDSDVSARPSPSPSPSPVAPSSSDASPKSGKVVPVMPADGVFGPASVWKQDISKAPTSRRSRTLVKNLAQQVAVRFGGVAAFNSYQYNVSFYEVPPDQRRIDVRFDNCQNKSYVPEQLFTKRGGAHFSDVPIPDNAEPARGTDGELSIWDPATDQLWEFWKANKQGDTWHACWGGRIDHVSTSPGYFPDGMGVSATGLSTSGASIGLAEARRGFIDHAMGLNVVDAANYSTFSYPAQRSDGTLPQGTPGAIQEGQRFRLSADVDVDALNLTPVGRMIAVAAKRYGFIVNDRAGAVAVLAENGGGPSTQTGQSPWDAILDSEPSYLVMANFPWDQLEALPHDYGKTS